MKYIKLFEYFSDKLIYRLTNAESKQFFNLHKHLSLSDEDIEKVRKLSIDIIGRDIKIHNFKDTPIFLYIGFPPTPDPDHTVQALEGMNVCKYDDEWFYCAYFPAKRYLDFSDRDPEDEYYKVDGFDGLEELLKELILRNEIS